MSKQIYIGNFTHYFVIFHALQGTTRRKLKMYQIKYQLDVIYYRNVTNVKIYRACFLHKKCSQIK